MRIFVCSPLSPKLPSDFMGTPHEEAAEKKRIFEANLQHARDLCRRVVLAGHRPFAPHLLFPQFLDEFSAEERAMGIRLGIDELAMCDEMWYWDEPTSGMKEEIAFCHEHGIKVVRWTGNAPLPLSP